MAYLTAAELRTRLTSDGAFENEQPDDAAYTAFLDQACAHATAIVNAYLGDGQPFAYDTLGTADAPITRTFTGDGSTCLALDLPLQQFIAADNGGMAVAPAGVWREPINAALTSQLVLKPESDGTQYGWDTARQSVTVTGVWGWGTAPATVIEATTEIAVRIVKGRSAGYSDVVGVAPDGTQQYIKAMPPLVKLALDLVKQHIQATIAPLGSSDFGSFGVA